MNIENKNFDKWNKLKKELHNRKKVPFFHEREIWWCALGHNIGFEQDGKNENFERPVLILRIFSREVLLIVPMTSQVKLGKYYYNFEYLDKRYAIITTQIRLISSRRLLRKIRTFPEEDYARVKNLIKNLL